MLKIEEGSHDPRRAFDELPGETVLEHIHDPREERRGLEFRVKKLTAGRHFPEDSPENLVRRGVVYEAATPYRNCVYPGRTAEEALGSLMLGVGLLSREGSLDPNVPHSEGSPIIQHLLQIASERLAWQVARRKERLLYVRETPGGPERRILYENDAPSDISRDNEIISALGTAVAALARIKDL